MKKLFTLISIMAFAGMASAQTTLTLPSSSPYSENFNTTPGAAGTTYPTGWGSYNHTATFDGSMLAGGSGSITGGNYNFSSNIGLLGSGSAFVPSSIVLQIGSTLGGTGFKISYNVVKIREQGRSNSFNLEISTTSATSGFAAVSGGTYESGTIVQGTSTAYTDIDISAIDNNAGPVYLRWSYTEISGSGSRDGIALDDVSITWSGALPISLVKFTADKFAEKVKVQWTTATEINNERFVVERSADGENFEYVAEIKGAGTSKELNSYELVDANPLKGTSYYRLTQYDFNGASESFTPVAVKMAKGSMSIEQLAGSPEQGAGSMGLRVFSPSNAMATIAIRDLSGRTLYSEELMLTEGYQNFNINKDNMGAGIYILHIFSGKESISKKIMIN